jgi:anti-sigma factor RsiW
VNESFETLPCASARDLLLQEPDGALTPTEAALLRTHLARCPECAREAERGSQVGALLRRDPLPLKQARLPSGEELARSVVEAAQGRQSPINLTVPWVRWAAGISAGLAAIVLWHAPVLVSKPRPVQESAAAASHPGFWIDDDERTGRAVLMESRPASLGAQ